VDWDAAIAKKLNEEGVPSPLKGQSNIRRVWNIFAVSAMLTNEKYRATPKVLDLAESNRVGR
jgi:hypothetical protein